MPDLERAVVAIVMMIGVSNEFMACVRDKTLTYPSLMGSGTVESAYPPGGLAAI